MSRSPSPAAAGSDGNKQKKNGDKSRSLSRSRSPSRSLSRSRSRSRSMCVALMRVLLGDELMRSTGPARDHRILARLVARARAPVQDPSMPTLLAPTSS